MKQRCMVLAVVLFLGSPCVSPAVAGGGSGMILATSGDVTVLGAGGATQKGAPMLVMDAGDMLRVAAGGTATFVSFADRSERAIVGPAEVRALADNVEVLSGQVQSSAPRMALALPKRSTLTSRAVLGQVARSSGGSEARFVEPVNFGTVLGPGAQFKWNLGSGTGRSLLIVWDSGGTEVFRKDVDGDTFVVSPSDAGLVAGGSYYAEVSPAGAKGPTARSEFRLLSADEAAAVRQAESSARTSATSGAGDPSALMLLMVTYLENRLYNQALATSDELEPLITDKTNLLRLRAHVHERMGLSDLAQQDLARAERIGAR